MPTNEYNEEKFGESHSLETQHSNLAFLGVVEALPFCLSTSYSHICWTGTSKIGQAAVPSGAKFLI